jgi:hypothetical protein
VICIFGLLSKLANQGVFSYCLEGMSFVVCPFCSCASVKTLKKCVPFEAASKVSCYNMRWHSWPISRSCWTLSDWRKGMPSSIYFNLAGFCVTGFVSLVNTLVMVVRETHVHCKVLTFVRFWLCSVQIPTIYSWVIMLIVATTQSKQLLWVPSTMVSVVYMPVIWCCMHLLFYSKVLPLADPGDVILRFF